MIKQLEANWRLHQLNRSITKIEKAYAKDRKKAKNEHKSSSIIYKIDEDEYHDKRIYYDEIEQIKSRILCLQARRFDVPIPADENDWEESNIIGGRALTAKGFAELRSAVRKEQNERWAYWELRLKVLGPLLAAATGAIGALIGLAATWKR